MAGENISANMSMPIPGVGVTVGPQYASDVNASLTIVDTHNHSPGSGVQITPAGLNISSDLSFLSNNAIDIKSARFVPQTIPLAGIADIACIYFSGVDLFVNDALGNQIQITQSGGIAGTPGSIANLVAPASAQYVSGSSTFIWQSNTNTPANMDFASAILRNLVANSKGLTLQPPNAMGADYALTLPSLPIATAFLTIDAAGAITGSVPTSGGITGSNIASGTITSANISATANIVGTQLDPSANILGSQLDPAAGIVGAQIAQDQSISKNSIELPSYGIQSIANSTYTTGQTIATFIITASGRPTICLINGTASTSDMSAVVPFQIQVLNGATPIGYINCNNVDPGGNYRMNNGLVINGNLLSGPSSYTFKVLISGGNSVNITGMVASAYEIT